MPYVVTAYRWGDTERHSYVVAVTETVGAACCLAHEEEFDRGGKYLCGIVEVFVDGTPPRAVVTPKRRPEIARSGAARRDELSEALLWSWAAEHHAHRFGEFCDEDNGATGFGDIPCRACAEIADMREAAAAEVERLMKEMR